MTITGLIVVLALTTAPNQAAAAAPTVPTASPTLAAVDDVQPSVVEEGEYPGAAQIEADHGIKIIKGNGLITLADCGASGLIQVRSAEMGLICFQVRSWPEVTGVLTMQIPSVYSIKGNDDDVTAKLTTPEEEAKTYPITKNEWTPVGEGADPENEPEALIELRATP